MLHTDRCLCRSAHSLFTKHLPKHTSVFCCPFRASLQQALDNKYWTINVFDLEILSSQSINLWQYGRPYFRRQISWQLLEANILVLLNFVRSILVPCWWFQASCPVEARERVQVCPYPWNGFLAIWMLFIIVHYISTCNNTSEETSYYHVYKLQTFTSVPSFD